MPPKDDPNGKKKKEKKDKPKAGDKRDAVEKPKRPLPKHWRPGGAYNSAVYDKGTKKFKDPKRQAEWEQRRITYLQQKVSNPPRKPPPPEGLIRKTLVEAGGTAISYAAGVSQRSGEALARGAANYIYPEDQPQTSRELHRFDPDPEEEEPLSFPDNDDRYTGSGDDEDLLNMDMPEELGAQAGAGPGGGGGSTATKPQPSMQAFGTPKGGRRRRIETLHSYVRNMSHLVTDMEKDQGHEWLQIPWEDYKRTINKNQRAFAMEKCYRWRPLYADLMLYDIDCYVDNGATGGLNPVEIKDMKVYHINGKAIAPLPSVYNNTVSVANWNAVMGNTSGPLNYQSLPTQQVWKDFNQDDPLGMRLHDRIVDEQYVSNYKCLQWKWAPEHETKWRNPFEMLDWNNCQTMYNFGGTDDIVADLSTVTRFDEMLGCMDKVIVNPTRDKSGRSICGVQINQTSTDYTLDRLLEVGYKNDQTIIFNAPNYLENRDHMYGFNSVYQMPNDAPHVHSGSTMEPVLFDFRRVHRGTDVARIFVYYKFRIEYTIEVEENIVLNEYHADSVDYRNDHGRYPQGHLGALPIHYFLGDYRVMSNDMTKGNKAVTRMYYDHRNCFNPVKWPVFDPNPHHPPNQTESNPNGVVYDPPKKRKRRDSDSD